MEQEVLAASAKTHLDALQTLTTSSIVLMLLTLWAAAQNTPSLSIFGVSASRGPVFVVAGLAMATANLGSCLNWLRLRIIYRHIDEHKIDRALTESFCHAWLLNPLAWFGGSGSAKLLGTVGWVTSTFVWMLGYASLSSIRIPFEEWHLLAVATTYLLSGLANLAAMTSVSLVVSRRASVARPEMANFTLRSRIVAATAGVVAGLLTICAMDALYRQM